MKEAIRNEAGKLSGLKLSCAGRASNLFWIGFGDLLPVTKRGETSESAENTLHIQCSWRMTKGNKIIVASQDFYSPNSDWDENEEGFNWEDQGSNRFDERIKSFMEDESDLIVDGIDSDNIGGLKVLLSKKYALEIFPDSSEDDDYSEFWRLISQNGNPHFIVSGKGIERV
ncbi:hypothetical protein ACOJQI_20880 [Bacillus salacetis]|uniref:hypothetical protein n=1 Tax=Bacillus salacetis TaxID=2315464 RepID=UPI003BA1ACEB